jgi:hypothetical protein
MELQVPMIRRILEEHPSVEYHVWNLTGNDVDDDHVKSIVGERITLFGNPHARGGPQAFKRIYRHYGQPEYRDCLFVKLDDDIVFLQTARFAAFTGVIEAHPGWVVSANIVNNGACAPLEAGLWSRFEEMGIPLLDVHKHNEYAEIAHNYFFEHHQEMLGQPLGLIPTEDWLSINMIGYNWEVACWFATKLGTVPHPAFIAGRNFPQPWGLMDEGAANMLPKMIVRGFVACHLTFGPQGCRGEQCTRWRERYGEVVARYLDLNAFRLGFRQPDDYPLPELSPVSFRQGGQRQGWGTSGEAPRLENDPCVGRFCG